MQSSTKRSLLWTDYRQYKKDNDVLVWSSLTSAAWEDHQNIFYFEVIFLIMDKNQEDGAVLSSFLVRENFISCSDIFG